MNSGNTLDELTPLNALRRLDRLFASAPGSASPEAARALDRLWKLVVEGK